MYRERIPRRKRRETERLARRLLRKVPKREANETAESYQERVFAYLEINAGTATEAFELYGAMLRLMGAPVPPHEEERALTRFARNLPPSPVRPRRRRRSSRASVRPPCRSGTATSKCGCRRGRRGS